MLPLFPFVIFILIIVGLVWQRNIAKRVDRMEKEIKALQARITGMTLAAPVSDAVTETAPAEPVVTAQTAIDAPQDETIAEPQIAAMASEAETPVVQEAILPAPETAPVVATVQAQEERESLESWLGARWAVWVGGVALAFGGLFLVKYTIEAGLLGPAARLSLAALFGLVLIAAGELIRRRAMPELSDRFGNAMIPGALTAAGSVTLMGAVWASYAVYEFIGPTPAFIALALVSFATIALSLLHGQALAGLGLLASLVTPALVATENPNANALFGFLALVWLAVNAASRFRQWTVVPTLANVGLGLWSFLYLVGSGHDASMLPAVLALLVMLAGTCFYWPGRYASLIGPEKAGISTLLGRMPLQTTLSVSLVTMLFSLGMLGSEPMGAFDLLACASILLAALAAFGALRAYAVWPAILAAIGAVLGMAIIAINWLDTVSTLLDGQLTTTTAAPVEPHVWVYLLLGAVFPALGFVFLKRFRQSEPDFSIIWAFLMPAVPVAIATISFLNFGNLNRDWTHGLYGIVLGLSLLAGADWLFRRGEQTEDAKIDWPANLLVAGSFAGFTLALHTLTNGIVTTIALSALGFLYVLAMRIRSWPALPWMMAAATLIVFGRIAWEPTVIGANSLGTTPFFNALLPGYGIPTLLAIASAWMLRNATDFRIRNIMQALASLSALITVAVLVRHAMNGGTLETTVPTLGEQSIYTLITVGFSGILMMLDLKSPSPVFRFGSMIAGVLATANVLSLHLLGLNPYITGEGTGPWPFFNLLLLGYLMPALAYALVAYLARERRPMPYVLMLAISGGILGFAWATLSVRRFWQGENIADWKGFVAAETYTYSVVWLLIGIVLLVLGSRFNQRSLRLASAALVLIAVLKVFLIDMSNLEGILRALSFMGLGGVLIGIGLFYQRILVKKDGNKRPGDSAATPEGTVS
ncbi:putative membrane protein [Neorhizobium sp. JUb45]|nr:putative membrane protein [Neorhizobium sp. JUb45]